jgi:hypothetical protein
LSQQFSNVHAGDSGPSRGDWHPKRSARSLQDHGVVYRLDRGASRHHDQAMAGALGRMVWLLDDN